MKNGIPEPMNLGSGILGRIFQGNLDGWICFLAGRTVQQNKNTFDHGYHVKYQRGRIKVEGLIERLLTGDVLSAAKVMTRIENSREEAARIIKEIFPHTGKAYLIGVTGSPGAGKSTLISAMIGLLKKNGLTIGVVAVDATSPFSGGAVLGDRIRMQKNEGEGVFVRSMATRGNLGGLSRATRDVSYVMDAMGRDIIIVETVGVGQVELEISKIAHTIVLALAPGMGDSIQAIKAGIMEIGDIFVINKADREGADDTEKEILSMLSFGSRKRSWMPEVFKTIATKGEGVAEFLDGVWRHKRYLEETDVMASRAYDREQLLGLIKEKVEKRILDGKRFGEENLENYVQRIIKREIDPYTASDAILKEMGL